MVYNTETSILMKLGAMQYLLYNMAGAESFLEPKKSRPCRHNSAKIIPASMYMKKVLARSVH